MIEQCLKTPKGGYTFSVPLSEWTDNELWALLDQQFSLMGETADEIKRRGLTERPPKERVRV